MNLFLRLKHWQLFILVIGFSFITNFVFSFISFSIGYSTFLFSVLVIVTSISVISVLMWYYTLGINLYKKLPTTIKLNLKIFKILLLTTTLYSIFFFYFLFDTKKNMMLGLSMNVDMMWYLMPFHLIAMICILYCLYFIANALKAIELKKSVSFNDSAGDFFLLLFYPIGIWVIQPRINKLFND
jgi:hypothetical protein